MDQYITVTSTNQNPCEFVSNFTESININDGYEVAVTKIFHGPPFNVTSYNNKFTLQKEDVQVDYRIPPGFYKGSCEILVEIYNELERSRSRSHNGFVVDSLVMKPPIFLYAKNMGESSSLRIADTDVNFLIVRGDDPTLLEMLGYCIDNILNKLTISHYDFETTTDAGLLYSNIVTNSIIDQQKSRLLAIFPIRNANGYNYHEFTNPVYKPLSIHSFTDITFSLTDIYGEIMAIHYFLGPGVYTPFCYPTIITLHIRKIRN